MAHSNPIGHLALPPSHKNETEARQIARMVLAYGKGVGPLLIELEMRGVFSRDSDDSYRCLVAAWSATLNAAR